MEDLKSEKVSKYRGLGGFGGFGRILEKMDGVGGLKSRGFFENTKNPAKSANPPEEPRLKPVGKSRRRF